MNTPHTADASGITATDEAPDAYKDFQEVLNSVERAGLATEVAKLVARFVIKEK